MKNSAFQSFFLRLNPFVPLPLAKAIYYPSFLIFKLLCKISFRHNLTQVYLRNSFFLNYLVFGLSDYDFGIILKKRIGLDQWNSFISKYRRLKLFFPFWGEINLYCEDEIDDLIHFINPIELKKDPYLSKRFRFESSTEERFVFLSRSFFTNLKNWKFESRKNLKLKTYFELCEITYVPQTQIEAMLKENLKTILKTPIQKNYINFVLSFHHLYQTSPDILWEESTNEVKVLFPHLYLWFEREEGSENFLSSLSESDKKILVSQLNWEVWGLMTQFYFFYGKNNFVIHLERIKKVFICLSVPTEQLKRIDRFLTIFNTIN